MLHYTLNTADTFDCSQKSFNRSILKILRPIAIEAIAQGQTTNSFPSPSGNYTVKVTAIEGAALFDIYSPSQILTTNAVAWTEEGQEDCWPLFEQFYLKLMAQFNTVSISRSPNCPAHLPWLSTLILPHLPLVDWLADFEQCLALELITASNSDRTKRAKPKGFG